MFVPMLWRIILPTSAGWLNLLNAVMMWWNKMCLLRRKVWGNFANHRQVGIKMGFLPSTTMASGAPTVDSAARHSCACWFWSAVAARQYHKNVCSWWMAASSCLSERMRGVHHLRKKNQSPQFLLLGSVQLYHFLMSWSMHQHYLAGKLVLFSRIQWPISMLCSPMVNCSDCYRRYNGAVH